MTNQAPGEPPSPPAGPAAGPDAGPDAGSVVGRVAGPPAGPDADPAAGSVADRVGPGGPEEVYWDGEYARGRFLDLDPEAFVGEILARAADHGLLPGPGLYVGVGNGRNYLPLTAGGLDLVGLDISRVGLDSIAERAPELRDRLVHGSLDALPSGERYPVVVGIQVFQHGTREQARALLRASADRVAPGGLFCVRVNAVGTEIPNAHEVLGRHDDGSLTVRYLAADHKPGLTFHFYSEAELAELLADFAWVAPPRPRRRERPADQGGAWVQWEFVARRPADRG